MYDEPNDAWDYETMRICGVLPTIQAEELEWEPTLEALIDEMGK